MAFVEGFEWDEGNLRKNWEKHSVSHVECKEIFFNSPIIVKKDAPHSTSEDRYFVLGKTDENFPLIDQIANYSVSMTQKAVFTAASPGKS